MIMNIIMGADTMKQFLANQPKLNVALDAQNAVDFLIQRIKLGYYDENL